MIIQSTQGDPLKILLLTIVLTGFLSAFINNTPVVIIFAPMLKKWADKLSLPSQKFLIPLSYATIFGGTCTLIGTSTNIVVSSLLGEHNLKPIGMFELLPVGIVLSLTGILYLTPEERALVEDGAGLRTRRLAESIHLHPHQKTLAGMMEEAGLERVEYTNLTGGIVALHRGIKL